VSPCTLADVAGTLLEFLENAAEGTVTASASDEADGPDEMAARPGEGGGSDPAVVLAVVRSLGRRLHSSTVQLNLSRF